MGLTSVFEAQGFGRAGDMDSLAQVRCLLAALGLRLAQGTLGIVMYSHQRVIELSSIDAVFFS